MAGPRLAECGTQTGGMWDREVLPAALPALFSATLSPALSVYLCVNVGLQGLLVV